MTSKEWKEYKIGTICEVLSSKRIFAADYVETGIPFYRSKEIIQKSLGENIEEKLYISKEKFLDIKTKFGAPQKLDLLLSAVGERSGIPYLVNDDEEFYFKDGNLIWFRNFNSSLINSNYLYYWLKSYTGQNSLQNLMIGSAQKALTIIGIKGLSIKLPPLETQEKIAGVLSSLDDKIELNNKINQNLEQQAQAIFDKFFGSCQIGNKIIGDYLTPKRGKNLLSKDAKDGNIPVIAGGLKPATYHNIANTTAPVITISASGANAGFVNLWHVPVWASDSSYIDSTINSYIYFWYILLKKRQKEIFDSQTGSAQPHIYPKHIEQMAIFDLNIINVKNYNDIVQPLFAKIKINQIENEKLTQLRDTLLPKLMSGEIDVDKVEVEDVRI